jgi:TatD DNase family protein
MILVDTHCHLDLSEFDKDLDEVMERARDVGVKRIIVPGVDPESSRKAVLFASRYEEVFAAVGIHPHYADKVTTQDIRAMRELATENDKVVAIGEIGLDNYRKYSDPEKQKELFSALTGLAAELDLPVIVHSREAMEEVMKVLRKVKRSFLSGVMHCFSGNEDNLRELISMGLFVSFAGNITFPKASGLREMASLAGLGKILLETDAPYMACEKHRGQRNEPSFVGCLTDVYADIFKISPSEAAEVTTASSDRLFRLGINGEGKATYKIRNSLYVNMTHRCTNRCVFCARQTSSIVKGHDLYLGREPERNQIIKEIGDPSGYDEIVFCGFGEPTLRLGALKEVAGYVKSRGGKVRVNTNGEANLINGRDVTSELAGLVDSLSVSLNAAEEKTYGDICPSVFGEKAHESIKEFVAGCVSMGIKTEVTCLDSLGEDGVKACRALGEKLGSGFRLRYLNEVG